MYVVLKLKWDAHMHLIMRDMNVLNIVNINSFQIDCFTYKTINNLLPAHLSNYFVKKTMYFTTTILGRVTICMLSNIAHKLGLIVYVLEVLLFETLLK